MGPSIAYYRVQVVTVPSSKGSTTKVGLLPDKSNNKKVITIGAVDGTIVVDNYAIEVPTILVPIWKAKDIFKN